jgi:hypothetical protein
MGRKQADTGIPVIELNGERFEVKYGILATRSIERELGKPINVVLEEFDAGNLNITALTTIIWAGLLHARRKLTPELVSIWLEAEDVDFREVAKTCCTELGASMRRLLRLDESGDDGENEAKN